MKISASSILCTFITAALYLIVFLPPAVSESRFSVGEERCKALYGKLRAYYRNYSVALSEAERMQILERMKSAYRCNRRYKQHALHAARATKNQCPRPAQDLSKTTKCLTNKCVKQHKENEAKYVTCSIKALEKLRDKEFPFLSAEQLIQLQTFINHLEKLLTDDELKDKKKKKKKKKKTGNVCKNSGGTTNVSIENNTDATLRAERVHRSDPLDPNTETTETLGDVAPAAIGTFKVASKYGSNRILLTPFCKGVQMNLNDPSIRIADKQLIETVPSKVPCVINKTFEVFDQDFVSTVLSCGDISNGVPVNIVCPSTVDLRPGEAIAPPVLIRKDVSGPDADGLVKESCFYEYMRSPTETRFGNQIIVEYVIDSRYFDHTGSTIACRNSPVSSYTYSTTRQFRLFIASIVDNTARQQLIAQFFNAYEQAGATCP